MTLHALSREDAAPLVESVRAEVCLEGAPQTRTFVTYDSPEERLCAGEWEADVGKWRVSYSEWEYCLVVSGRCIVTGDDGTRIAAGPGQSFVIEPGFSGTWEVVEPMRKHFVIRLL